MIAFFVEGKPQTAGSKSAIPSQKEGGHPKVVESGDRNAKRAWREDVREAARRAISGGGDWPFGGACEVVFVFGRRRPQSHYGSRAGVPYIKASAPAYPITRPDVLKVARAIEDALTGILWHDDAAIVDETLRKVWGDREGVWIEVRQLGAEASDDDAQATLAV